MIYIGLTNESAWKTSTASSGIIGEWNEEFTLPVRDASGNVQLECTLWDESNSQTRTSEDFLGEVILNLSKLVPYKGKYIEQIFEIKPSKTIKTTPPATGKLKLGLRLEIPAHTNFSKPFQAETSQVKAPERERERAAPPPSSISPSQEREPAAPPPASISPPHAHEKAQDSKQEVKTPLPPKQPSPQVERKPDIPQPVVNTSPRTTSPRLVQTQPVQTVPHQPPETAQHPSPQAPPATAQPPTVKASPAPVPQSQSAVIGAPSHFAASSPPSQPQIPSSHTPAQPSAFTSPEPRGYQNQHRPPPPSRPLPGKGGPANAGIDIKLGPKDPSGFSPLVVYQVLSGGPAAKSQQVQVGDVLIDIDGNDVVGRGVEEVQKTLHGDKGAPVTLILRRGGSNGPQVVVTVLRAVPPFNTVPPPSAAAPPHVPQQAKAPAPQQHAENRKISAPAPVRERERQQFVAEVKHEAKVPFRVSQAKREYSSGPLGSFEAVKRPKREGYVPQPAPVNQATYAPSTTNPAAYASFRTVAPNPSYRSSISGPISPRPEYQYGAVMAPEIRYAPSSVTSLNSRASYGPGELRSVVVAAGGGGGAPRGYPSSSVMSVQGDSARSLYGTDGPMVRSSTLGRYRPGVASQAFQR